MALVEMTEEEIALRWAHRNGFCFISNELISEFLSVPDINSKMMFNPSKLSYGINTIMPPLTPFEQIDNSLTIERALQCLSFLKKKD